MRFGSVVFSIRNSIIGVRSQTSDVLSRVDGSTLVLRIPCGSSVAAAASAS